MPHRYQIKLISFKIELVDYAVVTHSQFELFTALKPDVLIAVQSCSQVANSVLVTGKARYT